MEGLVVLQVMVGRSCLWLFVSGDRGCNGCENSGD